MWILFPSGSCTALTTFQWCTKYRDWQLSHMVSSFSLPLPRGAFCMQCNGLVGFHGMVFLIFSAISRWVKAGWRHVPCPWRGRFVVVLSPWGSLFHSPAHSRESCVFRTDKLYPYCRKYLNSRAVNQGPRPGALGHLLDTLGPSHWAPEDKDPGLDSMFFEKPV